jgi:hypothetical protein
MEIVFEKEIESVSNVIYFYSSQLVHKLSELMETFNNTEADFDAEILTKIRDFFSRKCKLICDRLANEVKISIELINENRMAYNDVKYTMLVCHVMFLRKLAAYCNDENTANRQIVFNKLLEHSSYLNCYLQSYLIE